MQARGQQSYRIPVHDRNTRIEPLLGPKRVYVIIVEKKHEGAKLDFFIRILHSRYQLGLTNRPRERYAIRIPMERIGSADCLHPELNQFLLADLKADIDIMEFSIVSQRETDA